MHDESRTDPELLRRARDTSDREAWNTLINKYHPKIKGWAKRCNIQNDADCDDLASDVMVKLVQYLPGFEYDPKKSFRAWLKKILSGCIADWVKKKIKSPRSLEDTAGWDLLANLPEEECASSLLEAMIMDEDYLFLLAAKNSLRTEFAERVWKSWKLSKDEGLSGKEVSQELGISVGQVYNNVNQVQNAITELIRIMREDG